MGPAKLGNPCIGGRRFPPLVASSFPAGVVEFLRLICGQMVLISLLFPALARTPWTLAINLVLILPVDELGAILSNLNQMQVLTLRRVCADLGDRGGGLALGAGDRAAASGGDRRGERFHIGRSPAGLPELGNQCSFWWSDWIQTAEYSAQSLPACADTAYARLVGSGVARHFAGDVAGGW